MMDKGKLSQDLHKILDAKYTDTIFFGQFVKVLLVTTGAKFRGWKDHHDIYATDSSTWKDVLQRSKKCNGDSSARAKDHIELVKDPASAVC